MKSRHSYTRLKWMNLLGFAFLYNTVYIGRFNLNNVLEQVAAEYGLLPGQVDIIAGSVFLSYAVGCFINGRIVDSSSPKKMIFMGTCVSIICNLLLIWTDIWQSILTIWLINGYFQSMIWISGIRLIAQWFSSEHRGEACGIANFFSGLSHITAYLIPVAISIAFPYLEWRSGFVIPMVVMAVFLVVFWFLATDLPEDAGKRPYEEDNDLVRGRESYLQTQIQGNHENPWKYFLSRPKFLWWCSIAMISSLCRYGLLKWIPLYYTRNNEEAAILVSPTFSNLILPLGMAFGTLALTWITGKLLNNNKGIMIIISAALCGALIIIFPAIQYSQAIIVGIFFTGFFLYGINGILWIYAMDRGGRIYPGTAAGILNCCAYIGAALEGVIFPLVMRATGQMIALFLVMEFFCIAMVLCGMAVCEKNTMVEAENE